MFPDSKLCKVNYETLEYSISSILRSMEVNSDITNFVLEGKLEDLNSYLANCNIDKMYFRRKPISFLFNDNKRYEERQSFTVFMRSLCKLVRQSKSTVYDPNNE